MPRPAPRTALLLLVMSTAHVLGNNSTSQLGVGRAINLFSRYGYLSISMRVVPRNDSEVWLFREPTVDVFQNVLQDSSSAKGKSNTRARTVVFDGDFHMEFCDNARQLFHAYFRDFSIEKLSKPWRAFTGSWSAAAAARELGINASYVSPQSSHSFILVRVARWRDSGRVKELMRPASNVQREMDAVMPGDEASVVNFVRSYGSHYVASYVTGNALYQVIC
ncbi:hypothetical protein B566_EDAN010831 [Ephemera danica]|nr:hypothetical protein B566_EDAN010831 [Ephemera danica]